MAAILNFRQKLKIVHISFNGARWSNFFKVLTPRLSLQDTLPKFLNFFLFQKIAAILNFRILVHVYICSAWATMTLDNICLLYIYISLLNILLH